MLKKAEFDYLVLGGGTAGAVVAARLAEDPDTSVCLVEAGPSDEGDWRILELWNWVNLLGTELDYDYLIEPQERGNGLIRHSRGTMLGGCSSHNSAIAFRTPDVDLRIWEEAGAAGWGPEDVRPYFGRLFDRVNIETVLPGNTCSEAFVEAARQAGFPPIRFNEEELREGGGWLQLNARGAIRPSRSGAYLHPIRPLQRGGAAGGGGLAPAQRARGHPPVELGGLPPPHRRAAAEPHAPDGHQDRPHPARRPRRRGGGRGRPGHALRPARGRRPLRRPRHGDAPHGLPDPPRPP